MRYAITDSNGEEASVEYVTWQGAVSLTIPGSTFDFTVDEFREFRRAVGYVWQEIERAGEEN